MEQNNHNEDVLFMSLDEFLEGLEKEMKDPNPALTGEPIEVDIPSDVSGTSKKYDLVILDPGYTEINDWRSNLNSAGIFGSLLKNGAQGWCCYIASSSSYFGPNSLFPKCFDCPEFPEAFHDLDKAPQSIIQYLNTWMFKHNMGYEMEGFVGFYDISTKADAINKLKSCPVIGQIFEIDSSDTIIAIY